MESTIRGAPASGRLNPVWPELAMRVQRKCACGGVCAKCSPVDLAADSSLQSKLAVDRTSGPFEYETDRIAEAAGTDASIAAGSGFLSLSSGDAIQRQTPTAPAPYGAASQNCARTTEPFSRTETSSERFFISEVTPPCFGCPNSPAHVCPKFDDWFVTGPVQFSWQARFTTFVNDGGFIGPGLGKKSHVVQKIEKTFDFSTAPADGYTYTSPHWEAFEVQSSGTTDTDYWQFDIPDGTSGAWSMSGVLYLSKGLPEGMAPGNVPDAGDLPSTKDEPKGLGRIVGSRSIKGKFDFTGTTKKHHQ